MTRAVVGGARGPFALIAALVLAAVTGCAAPDDQHVTAHEQAAGRWLLVSPDPGPYEDVGYPQAGFDGSIVVDDATGCVVGSLEQSTIGLLFPRGAALDPGGVDVPGSGRVELRASVSLSGGYLTRDELDSSGAEIGPCAYGEYFSINPIQ